MGACKSTRSSHCHRACIYGGAVIICPNGKSILGYGCYLMARCGLLAGVWEERRNIKDLCCLILFISCSSVVAHVQPSVPVPGTGLPPALPLSPGNPAAFPPQQGISPWVKEVKGCPKAGQATEGLLWCHHPKFTTLSCPTCRALREAAPRSGHK